MLKYWHFIGLRHAKRGNLFWRETVLLNRNCRWLLRFPTCGKGKCTFGCKATEGKHEDSKSRRLLWKQDILMPSFVRELEFAITTVAEWTHNNLHFVKEQLWTVRFLRCLSMRALSLVVRARCILCRGVANLVAALCARIQMMFVWHDSKPSSTNNYVAYNNKNFNHFYVSGSDLWSVRIVGDVDVSIHSQASLHEIFRGGRVCWWRETEKQVSTPTSVVA